VGLPPLPAMLSKVVLSALRRSHAWQGLAGAHAGWLEPQAGVQEPLGSLRHASFAQHAEQGVVPPHILEELHKMGRTQDISLDDVSCLHTLFFKALHSLKKRAHDTPTPLRRGQLATVLQCRWSQADTVLVRVATTPAKA